MQIRTKKKLTLSINYTCENGINTQTITLLIEGGSGTYFQQVKTEGGEWINSESIELPDGSFSYPATFSDGVIIRIVDFNDNSFSSNEILINNPTCSDSELIFNSIISDEHISFSAVNIYEVGNLWGAVPPDDILNLGMEVSYDSGATWTPMAIRRILTSSPYTGTEPDTFWLSVSFVPGFVYRLIGKDVVGNLVYSNEITF